MDIDDILNNEKLDASQKKQEIQKLVDNSIKERLERQNAKVLKEKQEQETNGEERFQKLEEANKLSNEKYIKQRYGDKGETAKEKLDKNYDEADVDMLLGVKTDMRLNPAPGLTPPPQNDEKVETLEERADRLEQENRF